MDRFTLAKNLGHDIGAYLRKEFAGKTYEVRAKADASVVTTVDIEAERRVAHAIHEYFPEDCVIGEEHGERAGTTGITWHIDPIDGTSNFAAGLPLYGASIGYANEESVQGAVIVLPELETTVVAEKGKGTHCNGKPVRVKPFSSLEKSTVLLSYRRDPRVYSFFNKHRKVRILGSAVVNACFVATGIAEAYWASSLNPWDYAAGMLLVSEAGGVVVNAEGERLSLPSAKDVIMSSEEGAASLVEFLRSLS